MLTDEEFEDQLTFLKRVAEERAMKKLENLFDENDLPKEMLMAKKEDVKTEVVKKKPVKFDLKDGKIPRQVFEPGNPFVLRMPLTVRVPPNAKTNVPMGVSCELPCVLLRGTTMSLVPPGQEFVIELDGGRDGQAVGEGELVARFYVLDNGECEAVR